MNKIILIGNLTHDPEANVTSGGVNFTRFTVAVNRPWRHSHFCVFRAKRSASAASGEPCGE